MVGGSISSSLPQATSLDSMEGVPEWPAPAESAAERAARGTWRWAGHRALERLGALAPGVGLALGLAYAADRLAHWLGTAVLGFAQSPVGPIPLTILLGLALRNTVGLPAVYEAGLRVCLRHVLRLGVVLLGLRLSLGAVTQIGLAGLPVILACIAAAWAVVTRVNRALGLPGRLGALIAVGTSICGVSAIVAAAPVVEAEDDEVSYAIACVALFGMLALFAYPFLAHRVFADDPRAAGVFLGTAIHDTAQVAGAGLMYQQQYQAPRALDAAAVTKLVRNLCMAWVIPLLALAYHRAGRVRGGPARAGGQPIVPLFVVGFVAMAALRTVGDAGARPLALLTRDAWRHGLAVADTGAAWCLAAAMAAVGLGTELAKLKGLGLKPFCVGLAAALLVGGVSLSLLLLARSLGWA
jgi:uncharacterized integral membrane protein (TIGR00698 family)